MMNDQTGNSLSLSVEKVAECLKLAREARGKTIQESSRLLGIPASRLRNYENGRIMPSLPELESLSYVYDVPLTTLLNPESLIACLHAPDGEQLRNLIEIRQHLIATRLQITREKSGKSLKTLSSETSIPVSRLKRYEKGSLNIGADELDRIARALGLTLADFLDMQSPLGLWQENQTRKNKFGDLPQEIQSFYLESANQPFIDFVQKVKAIGVENFSHLSESIQQIMKAIEPKE